MLRNAEVLGLLVPDFFSFFFFFDPPTQNQETHSSANEKERDGLIVYLFRVRATSFFTTTAEILARLLASFYCQ